MADRQQTEHLTSEELVAYFEEALPEDQECRIEEHLAECSECTQWARQYRTVRFAFDQWTARAHGDAYRRGLLVAALEQAEESAATPGWQERLRLWRERWAGQVEGALGLVIGAPGEACRLVYEGFDALVRPRPLLGPFAPVPAGAPSSLSDAQRLLGTSLEIRGAHRLLPTLGPSGTATPDTVAALAPGDPQAYVGVSGEAREVTVRIDELPPGQTAPLVLLIREEGGEPRVAEPQEDPRLPYLIARFEDVEPGRYLAAFEPMEWEDE